MNKLTLNEPAITAEFTYYLEITEHIVHRCLHYYRPQLRKGYVFTGVCHSVHKGGMHGGGVHGGVHGGGQAWGMLVVGGMCGGGAWRGACMAGGVRCRERAWWGTCVVGGMHGRGHVWQGVWCSCDVQLDFFDK